MRNAAILTLTLVAALALLAGGTAAQEATPDAAGTCLIAPRDEADLIALNASPPASPTADPDALATTPMEMPDGEPIDAATLNALDETLRLVIECAEAGDIARLLALYSDAYVAKVALAPEPVPIVPGQADDHAHVPSTDEEIEPGLGLPPRVEMAVLLDDGRVAATTSVEEVEGTRQIVIFAFVEEEGRWVIDEIHSVLPEGPIGGDLPFAVQAAVAAAAAEAGVDPATVTVVSYEAVEWPDTALGCPKEGEFYAQVITPGYLVVLSVEGIEMEYHTDEVDRAVRCDLN
jgi:hypothetical protein